MCFSFASVIVYISHCKALWVKSQTFFARKLQKTIDISHVDNYNNHIGQLSSKKDRQKGVNIMKPLEIKGARARLGFTQKYMAEKLGLTEVSYGRKERGEVEFTLDEVPEVASLLTLNNAQVNDFFFDGKLPTGYQKHIGNILDAMLPAGSITGAPKDKTMEIIHEAEGYDRGFYTGVMGIYNNGELNSAVMIRFFENDGLGTYFKAGGGITSKSDCSKEYEEVLQKVYLPFE